MQDHAKLRLNLLNRTVLNLINAIEDRTGKMFHEFDAELDKRCMETMDSKNVSKLHILIGDLEEIERTI